MNIIDLYTRMAQNRNNALDRAETAARLTITSMEPKGTPLTGDIAYSMEGADALQTLSSLALQVHMPSNQRWHRLAVPDEVVADMLGKNPSTTPEQLSKEIEQATIFAENQTRNYLSSQKVKSRLAWAVKRNLVEGTTGLRLLKDAMTVFPLRNMVVKRHAGDVLWWIVEEEVVLKPGDTVPVEGERIPRVYTLIDYTTGKVYEQREGTEEAKAKEGDGSDPKQWVLFSAMTSDIDDYPEPLAYFYRTMFMEMDGLLADLGRASAAAAWCLGAINPGSTVTPKQLEESKSGDVKFFNAGDVGFVTTGIKVSDMGLVMERVHDLRSRKDRIFGGGVRDRGSGDRTATEVLRMIEELERDIADLMANYDETLMHPLVRAAMIAQGIDVRLAGGKEAMEVVITTGQSALQRQIAAGRMVQGALMAQQLDPALFNRRETFTVIAEVEGFEKEGARILVPEITPEMMAAAQEGGGEMEAPLGSTEDTAGGPQPSIPSAAKSMQTDGRSGRPRVA